MNIVATLQAILSAMAGTSGLQAENAALKTQVAQDKATLDQVATLVTQIAQGMGVTPK